MAVITNTAGLPRPLILALQKDNYNRGECDYTVTELLKPPRQRELGVRFKDQITEDAMDCLYRFYGKIVHSIIEASASENELTEKRLYHKFGNIVVSGQIDSLCLQEGILSDWKFTTAWSFIGNKIKPEWESQLNMLNFLLVNNGHKVSGLQIVGLLRDHQISKAETEANYPKAPVAIMPIPMWSMEKTESFFQERIKAMESAKKKLPYCTANDMWKRNGKRLRCERYCNVSSYCEQYLEESGF